MVSFENPVKARRLKKAADRKENNGLATFCVICLFMKILFVAKPGNVE